MSTTVKETYIKLKKDFPELPEWKSIIYFAGIPKKDEIENAYQIIALLNDSVTGLINNFLVLLTPNNFMAMQDQKICKGDRDKILKAIIKCGYILRQSMSDLMDATLKDDYEKEMAKIARWISDESRESLEFFHKNAKRLAKEWKTLKPENNNQNHFSY